MHPALKTILEIQELDIKMIQLMRVKRERQKELRQIEALRKELNDQLVSKKHQIEQLDEEIKEHEKQLEDLAVRIKGLEARQSSVKKVDEFNACCYTSNNINVWNRLEKHFKAYSNNWVMIGD